MLAVIIVAVAVLVVVVVVLARRGAQRASGRVGTRLAQLDVQRQAKGTFLGLASAGEGQVRRLGTLVLTPGQLVFVQFVPEGEVAIALAEVTAAEAASTYLGRSHDGEVLVVSFGGDQAAWELPDVHDWVASLVR